MRNLTLSEMMHTFPLKGFKITGDFNIDAKNYIEFKKMPIWQQTFENELYAFPLYRLSFGENIIVHTLTDGVIEKIKHTKIENMPNEIPNLMKKSFLLESRRDKPLFNNIYSIGGFTTNGEMCLLIKTITGNEPGLFCQHEKTSFDGRKIEDINLIYNEHYSFDSSYKEAKTRKDTFAFVIIFSLMLEAERTPFIIENKKEKTNKKHLNIGNETEWITKRVYIDKNIKYKNNSNEQTILDKSDKKLKDVIVNGFLRKQHYGPELSQTKWIYIDSFDSTRWTNNKDTKIIIDIYGEK